MTIRLKKLKLTNFKGIRSFEVTFGNVTNIHGDNATGKTSLFDAFLWLLFNKDSTDRKDFEIKTLDENNQPFHKLEHEVHAILEVDGVTTELRKSYREKWVKKRGSAEQEFAGHETNYFWNDVPMKQDEYQSKISSILNESIFKLITNTTYFNSMKWQERRGVLMQIAGEISDHDVLTSITNDSNRANVLLLAAALEQKKTIAQYKSELAAKKKKIKDELDLIPSRISEANMALPEEKDYDFIEAKITTLQADIEHTDSLLMSSSKAKLVHAENINTLITKRQSINRSMMDIEFEIRNKATDSKRNRESGISSEKSILRSLNDNLIAFRSEYANLDSRKKKLNEEQDSLRDQWLKVDGEKLTFEDGQFACPTCKREYEESDVDAKKKELQANFNKHKSDRLTAITLRGQEIGKEISDIEIKMGNLKATAEETKNKIVQTESRIANMEMEHTRLTDNEAGEVANAINAHEQYLELKNKVEELTTEIDKPFTAEDNSALRIRKSELSFELDTVKSELSTKGQREKQVARIKELSEQESTMAQELASFEGVEFLIENFMKAKMDTLEKRINNRFKIVRFKMFEDQINGGQTEACTVLINGVPYSDANTGAKINGGLDIITVLSKHYDCYAPIFFDNAESVTKFLPCDTQIIKLIVNKDYKKLTVVSDKKTEHALM